MKILIEGEKYKIETLEEIFDDSKFYHQEGNQGTILSVGYYHSYANEKSELIYMLPKVFMANHTKTVFGIDKDELLNFEKTKSFKHKSEYNWIRQTSVYFYNSLLEFKKRNANSNIVETSLTQTLNTNLGNKEYSYLDLLLSFVNFYKKNKDLILFKNIEFKSKQAKKVSWEKTIRKSLPLINNKNQPIYSRFNNKKKIVDNEEELLIYFYSIINKFNTEHNLFLNFDKSIPIIKGNKFQSLQKSGLSKLKKIKYKYFNDTMKKMYHLCEVYFEKTDTSSTKRQKSEFLNIRNYNLVFEDMIDKLFSDKILNEKKTKDEISLKNLKYNEDGKIIDHIYDYRSLLDTSNIFYIGDSKYYKSDNLAGKVSKYKQFTYAKNVIQYNIDLLNSEKSYKENIRYRDDLTEGYNITPNFFIYGYIKDYKNFDNDELEEKGEIVGSYHFEDRLFDRDTLFVHQYKINFLYVLKSYSQFRNQTIKKFREQTKKRFRANFIDFFNSEKSKFELYEYKKEDFKEFVNDNFRKLNGKTYLTLDKKLILAKYENDNSLNDLIDGNLSEYQIK